MSTSATHCQQEDQTEMERGLCNVQ